MNYNGKQTVVLVSSPGIIREATTVMLESIPQVESVVFASGALSAIEHMNGTKADLLVIDANLPAEEVESLVRWSKRHQPDTRCIVLVKGTSERESAYSAGADVVFLRSSSARQLAQALWLKDQE